MKNQKEPNISMCLETYEKNGTIDISVYSDGRCDEHADVVLTFCRNNGTVVGGIIVSVALLKSLLEGVRT